MTRCFALLLVLILFSSVTVVLFPVCAVSFQDDWPMLQHDAAHTSHSAGPIESISPVALWSYSPEGTIAGSPVIADGTVYFSTISLFFAGDYELYAVNASTGKPVWNASYGTYPSTPAVASGYVYTSSFAFNASTGEVLLNYTTNGAYGSPTVAGGILLINTNFGSTFGPDGLIALNAKTGVKMWDFNEGRNTVGGSGHLPGFENNSPAIANGVVYFQSASGIYALNLRTGAQIWRVPIFGYGGYTTVADGNVYSSLPDAYPGPGRLYCFDAYTGSSKWTYQTVPYQPSVANGIIYVGPNALNASTGKPIWSNALLAGNQAIGGGIVYSAITRSIYHGGGEYSGVYKIYALNASTGGEEWNYTFAGPFQNYPDSYLVSFPAIAYGMIFISTQNALYAFGAAQPNTNSTRRQDTFPITPTVIVSVVVAVGVGTGLLIYFKTRKRQR